MVDNPHLPFVVPMNKSVRPQMKLDCHVSQFPFFALTHVQQFFITRHLDTIKLENVIHEHSCQSQTPP